MQRKTQPDERIPRTITDEKRPYHWYGLRFDSTMGAIADFCRRIAAADLNDDVQHRADVGTQSRF